MSILRQFSKLSTALRSRSNKARSLINDIEERIQDYNTTQLFGLSIPMSEKILKGLHTIYIYTLHGDYNTAYNLTNEIISNINQERINMSILHKRFIRGDFGYIGELPDSLRHHIVTNY
jgi:hypothetical protein